VFLNSFWIDRTEVTNAQFRLCVEAGACEPPHDGTSYSRSAYYGNRIFDHYPVIHINWFQALAYCTWAGSRLPTEAEWEYVARGSEGWLYPWGDEFEGTRLNYCDAYCNLSKADKGFSDGYLDTAPVGSYLSGVSWCGALDMTGNVWEWVMDWMAFYPNHPYHDRPSSIPAETYRVIRGGSWDTTMGHARTAFRNWLNPFQTYDSVGFRCASTTISLELADLSGNRLTLSSHSK
jgi:serine/threonine-protein kinase